MIIINVIVINKMFPSSEVVFEPVKDNSWDSIMWHFMSEDIMLSSIKCLGKVLKYINNCSVPELLKIKQNNNQNK